MDSSLINEILGPLPDLSIQGSGRFLAALHQLTLEGVPARVIGKLERLLMLSPPQSARLLAVSETSRKRLKKTPTKHLDEAASDRVIRIVSAVAEAAEILGDNEKAVSWFKAPSLTLRGQVPLDLMISDSGAQIVRDELNRIRYGHWA